MTKQRDQRAIKLKQSSLQNTNIALPDGLVCQVVQAQLIMMVLMRYVWVRQSVILPPALLIGILTWSSHIMISFYK